MLLFKAPSLEQWHTFQMGIQPLTMAMLVPCPIHRALKLTRGCQESIPGMKNDVTFSCRGHINHAITISSSLDTDLDFSPPPLPKSLHSRVTDFSLLLHFSTSLSPFLSLSPSLPPSLPAQRMPLVTAPISAF